MYNQTLKILLISSFFLFATFSAQATAEKIDINSASLEDLRKIIHIGDVRAQELISLRPFSSLDDLARIKGIAEKRIEDIKNQGLACVCTQEEPKLTSEPEPEPVFSTSTEEVIPADSGSPQGPQGESEAIATSTEIQPVTYPSGVVINEILPSPQGPDEEEEWIEIYNQNNFEADLSDWQIGDSVGKTNTYTFPEGTIISPEGFLVLSRPISGITLNNGGDGLSLIRPDGEISYAVNYEKAPRGESFNRTEDEWVWSKTLTPGSANIVPTAKEAPQPKESKSAKAGSPQTIAAVGGPPSKSSNSRLVISIAAALAIFSGTIILALKRKANA